MHVGKERKTNVLLSVILYNDKIDNNDDDDDDDDDEIKAS